MVDFKNLKVWQRAMDFAEEVYFITKDFPIDEKWVLTGQLRRAAVSIFSNIAEGCRRNTDRELISFLFNARGSCGEVESQLIFSERIGYVKNENVRKLIKECDEISRMLSGYIKYLREGHKKLNYEVKIDA